MVNIKSSNLNKTITPEETLPMSHVSGVNFVPSMTSHQESCSYPILDIQPKIENHDKNKLENDFDPLRHMKFYK
ncbi:MAG: hypothetical protein ACTSWN_07730 [Promethearchaeota archaeon]